MIQNKRDFKVWLATNELDQKQLASILEVTEKTISNYNANNRYPVQFQYALIGIACSLNNGSNEQ